MAFGATDFQAAIPVSRETLDKLCLYAALLEKWQRHINLVSGNSLGHLWCRHMLDSAQLVGLADIVGAAGRAGARCWLDIGSGAGFPGLVVAIMGAGKVHLVESDGRKCAFLHDVIRRTGAPAEVHNARIESLAPLGADVIVARALAPLPRLLGLCRQQSHADSLCLFLKGQDVEFELTEASKCWKISASCHPSQSEARGRILAIRGPIDEIRQSSAAPGAPAAGEQ